jgi:hypothetical protein
VILFVLICGVHLERAIANVLGGLAGRSLDVSSCSGVCRRYCAATAGLA